MTLQHGMTRGGRSMVGCVNGGWNLWSLTRLEFRFIMRKCEIEILCKYVRYDLESHKNDFCHLHYNEIIR